MKKNPENMNEETLIENIENDKILKTFTDNLKQAKEFAQGRETEISARMATIQNMIDEFNYSKIPTQSNDINDIEKAAMEGETVSSLERKHWALRQAKSIPWTSDLKYITAMIEYLEYSRPILTELEDAKSDLRHKIKTLEEIQKREMRELQLEFKKHDNEVIKILTPAGLQGTYIFSVWHEAQFGRIPRSEYTCDACKEGLKKSLIPEEKERTPIITKHEGIDGVQRMWPSKKKI